MRFLPWIAVACVAFPAGVGAQELKPDVAAFRALYRELVEINTTQSVGDCTRAANAMAARLKAGGYAPGDIHIVIPPGHPRRGNLVAILHGIDSKAKAILLLAHIDVVEARREDWDRDPFKLVEEKGYFYARGAADDKAMAAILTDNMIRYQREGYRPRRDIKLALTCGEETPEDFDGARYLVDHERALIDAGFAINENGSGVLDKNGKRLAITMQAGQKVQQHFRLEVTGPGGVSSGPPKDTPITEMARALARVSAYEFPLNISASSKAYLAGMSKLEIGQKADDMRALLKDPPDAQAAARMAQSDPRVNSMLRTTCAVVMVNAGEAESALPRRATALLDCHIAPSETVKQTQDSLVKVIADPKLRIEAAGDPGMPSSSPPISEKILGPARQVAEKMWPGVPLIPYQVNGADDGRFLTPAGIPTYGLSGLFREPGNDGTHGLNEHIRVQSLYDGRDFLYTVVKQYADANQD
jgi:acetylornithine deacetylase/succinyl-diaminopimelate desuccinylase-like protein